MADGSTPKNDTERALETVVAERDENAEWADRLAYAIGSIDEIGEHSNLNNPWANALELLAAVRGVSHEH